MRQPDRPGAGRSGDDSPAGGRGQAADLTARLLRLPAGHPSGDRGTSGAGEDCGPGAVEDAEPGERQGGADDGDDATGAEDDITGEPGRRAGHRGGRGWLGERGGGPVGAPARGRDPYRPWFAGDSAQPWFAADSDGLLGGSDRPPADADGLLSERDDPPR